MKKITLSVLFFLIVFIGTAQEWLTNIETAKEIAVEKDQHIVLVFQGSDWCAPCIKLEKEIWSSKEFKTYAKNNFVLIKADFPRKKTNKLTKEQQFQNNQLMEKYNLRGYFPYVAVLDKNGKVLGSTGYKKTTPAKYIKILASF
ncbi:MAG: thioredoxin family protein [Lutibacter sp.]|uniref:thioredoxin family protein n=1 Tax=Lutibacter sp. TaxID=1925666 RepID=UPI00385B4B79